MAVLSFALQLLSFYMLTRIVWFVVRPFRVAAKGSLAALPVPPGGSFFFGHAAKLFGGSIELQEELDAKGLVVNLGEFLGNGALLLSDPKALHHVLVKDQHIFEETPEAYAIRNALFGQGLLSTFGKQHRRQRKMLNPVFSINHMRAMVPTFHDIGIRLLAALSNIVAEGRQEVDIYDWMSRSSLEAIAQSGLGHSFDSFASDQKEHPYRLAVRQLPPLLFQTAIFQMIVMPVISKWNLGGQRFQHWAVSNLTWGSIRALERVVDTMDRTSREIYEDRKKILEIDEALDGPGKDILTILMKSNMESELEDRLPHEEIIAQITTFVFAGTDTTASAMCRLLSVLAQHQDVQDRLREEIRAAQKRHGEVDYDQLFALPYLDAVCRETLRLHPPIPVMTRTTLQDSVLPLHTPIRGADGQELTELVVPKGTMVAVSISGCNRAPALWGPDALEWRPERWLNEASPELVEAKVPGVYSHLLTFLGGGRACIGFKFAQLELKILLFHIIGSLKFRPTNHEISWRSFGVVSPAVDSAKLHPEFPIHVEMADF